MLARLQQGIVFSLLMLLAAWLYAARGWPFWVGLAGVVALASAHAVFLAFEFLLMHAVNRGDPAPRAGWWALVRAWAKESLTAPRVFLWQQPMRSNRWPDHLPVARAGQPAARRGVVFVHGFVCNRGLWNPWLERLTREDRAFCAVNLEPVFGSIDAYVPIIDAAVRRVTEATGLPPLVVCHSMGGLAVRAWLRAPAGRCAGRAGGHAGQPAPRDLAGTFQFCHQRQPDAHRQPLAGAAAPRRAGRPGSLVHLLPRVLRQHRVPGVLGSAARRAAGAADRRGTRRHGIRAPGDGRGARAAGRAVRAPCGLSRGWP
jgi:hypothetical protein